jgi:hypothetical protein
MNVLRTWFRSLFSSRRSAVPRPHRPKSRRPRQLFVESLEERTVPSILFSNTGSRTIVDDGGPIISSVQVDLIFWGSGWNSGGGPSLRTSVQNSVSNILNSPYFDGLGQYRGIGHGSLFRSDTITSSNPGATFTDGDTRVFVRNNINNNTLPSPTSQLLYLVVPQPGSTITGCGCDGDHASDVASGGRIFFYGVTTNGSGTSLDTLTTILSHEMVEAVTNPRTDAQPAFHASGNPLDEISDAEAENYTFRVNGALVQSFDSQRDHAYVVPNGSTNNFLVSSGRVLSFQESPFGFNNIFTNLVDNGVYAELNSSTAQFEPGAISAIQVNLGNSNGNRIEIAGTPVPVTVTGSGTGLVEVGASGWLNRILSTVSVNSPTGSIALYVDDSADTFADRQVTLTDTALTIGPIQPVTVINFSAISSLTYESGPGRAGSEANSIHVLNTPSAQTTIRTRGSHDFVQIHGNQGPLGVGGFANNSIWLGDNGWMNRILAPITVANVPGLTAATLTVDDSADNYADRQVTLTDTALTIGPLEPVTVINFSAITSLTYEGGPGRAGSEANSIHVRNTPRGTSTTIRTRGSHDFVQIHGNQGPLGVGGFANNSIWVGDNGWMNGILAPITVANVPGLTAATLTLDDSADNYADRQVTLTDTALTIGPIEPVTVINFSAITSLTYNAGPGSSGSNIFFVQGTAAGTNTTLNSNGSGDNEFYVRSDTNAVLGALALHGRQGSNSFLVYYDYTNPSAQTYTFTTTAVSRSGAAPVTFDGLNQVILYAPVVGGNTINVRSLAAGVFANLTAANGDTMTLGANQRLTSILGPVAVSPVNMNVSATVIIDDSGNTTPLAGAVTFSNQADYGYRISGLAPERIYLLAGQNTTLTTSVRTGAGDKTFNVQAAPQGVALTLTARSGTNTLDYTGYAGNVLVDLPLGYATGFSGISNIQNVTGASGGPAGSFNILVGNGGNILTGGIGRRNLLIAGGSASTLIGGDDEDILIGGTTIYDTEAGMVSLQAIMDYWAGTDDYDTRVANLTSGAGVPLLDASTVTGNQLGNTLTGNAGRDLFFGDLALDTYDWDPATETFISV